ncbi:MAG: type II secretion system GspH family protein [Patescibacteria group bacterium]|nr:type II secretion system GspH family protein [Patescibacteria group bacterium]
MHAVKYTSQRGFTLIELLVVIGIIGILAAVVLVAVNPGRQFASAQDTQRRADLYAITNAIYQYASENNGNIPSAITATPTTIGTGGVNLATVLVPTYLATIPQDPSNGTPANTQYIIFREGGRIVASAASELNPGRYISVVR